MLEECENGLTSITTGMALYVQMLLNSGMVVVRCMDTETDEYFSVDACDPGGGDGDDEPEPCEA
jgi:CubicO group peptidase (beta-lactamase class C family)